MFAGYLTQDPNIQTAFQHLAGRPEGLAHVPYDNRGSWFEGEVGLLQQRFWNTAESRGEDGVISHGKTQTRIGAWARIDNRAEILEKLPADLESLAATDTGLILAAYLEWGEGLCEHLIGDFAFAIYDGPKQRFILARDHTGVRPLYYFWNGKDFAFATSLAILDGAKALELQLSQEWMARYLLACSEDWSATTFEKVKKVPPAHLVIFDGSEPHGKRYFDFSAETTLQLGSDEEYVETYREVFKEAVACRVRSQYPIGSESTGGLDSSSVTALASEAMEDPACDLHTYAFVSCEQEPECILSLSQMWPMRPTHQVTDFSENENTSVLWSRFWQANGTVSEHSDGYHHHPFYEEAKKSGVRTMLSGFGGDEFSTNSGGLARVEFLRSRQYRLLASRSPGNALTASLRALKWVLKYYRCNNIFETATTLIGIGEKQWDNRIVVDRFADERLRHLASEHWRYDAGCLTQNEFTLNDRWSPSMTARLENCTLMAATYGVEYRWPLMDIRLLKLFLSIPAQQKLGPKGMGRWLHRRAVADKIPDFIAWKDKSMGDAINAESSPKPADGFPTSIDLEGSPLQQIVDPQRLAKLLGRLPKNPAEDWHDQDILERLNSLGRWIKSRETGYQSSA